jgi:lipopolysaccharide export system protein LptA
MPISKIRAFNCRHASLLLIRNALCHGAIGVAALGMSPVWAEKADRQKPMNIEADALKYDDAKQISVFTGRVVLTKGTIVIRGGQLEARQDPQGNQFGMVTAELGKLAFFRQKRDGLEEFIEGEGEVIEYDGKADTVKFVKRAQLRRYRGAVLNDELTGGTIFYDNTTDVFTIDGGATRGTPATSGGRVRAMLTPKPDSAAATGPAPVPSGMALKASPALALEKK